MITTLKKWAERNSINDEMYWKSAAQGQIEKFQKLADELELPIHVIGTHTSKSITLPVVQILGTHGNFIIRDNFYDYNLAVEWDFPIHIPLKDVYPVRDWEWYLENIQRSEEYCRWNEWTEEEINDPRMTRIEVKRHDGSTYWRDYKVEEKERWINRFKDTSWYAHDWSSGKLIVEGEMGEGCTFYIASYPYAEGIDVRYDYYELGATQFLIALNEVSDIVKQINNLKTPGRVLKRK